MISALIGICSFWAAAADTPKILIFPRPQEGSFDSIPGDWQKWFSYDLKQDTILIAIGSGDSMTRTAAEVCSTEIHKALYWAMSPAGNIKKIWIDRRNTVPGRAIVIGDKNTQLIKNILGGDTVKIPNRAEGYYLQVKDSTKIICAGYDRAGTFYAATTLRELVAQHYGGRIAGIWIRDWPDIPWRQAFWENAEIGGKTTDSLQLAKLDYLSLLKCNRVEHMNHRAYTGPRTDPESPPTPDYYLIEDYNKKVDDRNLPLFWYPKYRAHNIEPIPSLMNFGQPFYDVVFRSPSCIEGTEVKNLNFKFVGDTALPLYSVPELKNPTFDFQGGSDSGWTAPSGNHVDRTTYRSSPASIKFAARKPVSGKNWTCISQTIDCDPGKFYLFSYWIKTEMVPETALTGGNGGYCAVYGQRPDGQGWTVLEWALGPNNRTKWRQRIETSTDWKKFDLGVYSKDCTRLRIELGVELSKGAPVDSVQMWVDGDSTMRFPNHDLPHLTQQQRFLIKTPTDRPKVFSGDQLLTEGKDYLLLHDTLTYCYNLRGSEGGEINDSSQCWVFKSLNPSQIPPGTVVRANYDYVDWNNYYFTDGPRYNYCPSAPETRTLLKTEDSLVSHRLSPVFIDHIYNEVTQGTINGDSRCTATGRSPAQILADDIVFHLEHSQSGPTMSTKILLSADGLIPEHNGKTHDNIWQAIKLINDAHPSYPSKIIPWIWGFNNRQGTLNIPYPEFRDSIYAAVDTLNHYGYKPIFAYYSGGRTLCLKWLNAYRNYPQKDSITGFTVHPDPGEDAWHDRREFEMMPFGLDYAWHWRFFAETDTSDFALYGNYPNSENQLTPGQLHKNYGEIFSPIPANFKADAIENDTVKLVWSPNLNINWISYKIDRYDGRIWHEWRALDNRIDTAAIDPAPIWIGSADKKDSPVSDAGFYARYRISAFDDTTDGKLSNQSPYAWAQTLRPLRADDRLPVMENTMVNHR